MNKLGVKISDKRLNNLFLNPICCGLIVSIMVPGKLIPGKHEPLFSTELFFAVHIIRLEKRVGGFVHDNYNLPLKIFTRCDNCKQTMTGYLVKKKNLYYYKCRTKGCKVNRSATAMRDLFRNVLKTFQIGNQEVTIIKVQLEEQMAGFFKSEMEQNKILKFQLSEIRKKSEAIEERFAIGEIDGKLYDKFKSKYKKECFEIVQELKKIGGYSSNLEKVIDFALEMCRNLS